MSTGLSQVGVGGAGEHRSLTRVTPEQAIQGGRSRRNKPQKEGA